MLEVVGGCRRFAYNWLTSYLPFADHVQNLEQDVRGAMLGLPVVAQHLLTICLRFVDRVQD